ncbi:MAG: outer membrane beta-barrel protein [Spirochaetes bacterium]|nr:outer membrane beta-barrel protein [Spirochaetota bacterium]
MNYMKILLVMICIGGVCFGYGAVQAKERSAGAGNRVEGVVIAAGVNGGGQDEYESGLQNRDARRDIGSPGGKEDRLDRSEAREAPAPKKKYISIRRRRSRFEFHMGFCLGAVGYSILGPRAVNTERYRFRYEKWSFTAGFRGGIDALFYITRHHCLSVGAFYEQRKIQIKIVDLGMARIVLPGLSPELLYFIPGTRYVDKSNVDTNYVTFPVAYRFYVMDEFYVGASLDVAVLFGAKAFYNVVLLRSTTHLTRQLEPIDFGGRLLFGFTMNRVFLEIGIGCGFLDIDRLAGERHSLSVTGMIGYRI